jgi:hypothetical protein
LLRDNPYATSPAVPTGSGVTAVLDGQQRLLALNIAIYGSIRADRLERRLVLQKVARVEAMLWAGAEVSGDLD